jgi:PAS domain S-box-containing protein
VTQCWPMDQLIQTRDARSGGDAAPAPDPRLTAYGGNREAMLERLLDAAGAVPWEADPRTGHFIGVGKRAVDFLGYSLEQWCQPDFWVQRLHPDDRECVVRRCREALVSEKDTAVEYRMLAADGHIVWIRHVVIGRPGTPGGESVWGVLIDVTQQRETERRLQEEKQLADGVIENLPGWFFMLDRHRRLVRWNKSRERVQGFSPEEFAAMHVGDTNPPEERKRIIDSVERAFQEGTSSSEHHMLTKDGRRIPVLAQGGRVTIGGEDYVLGLNLDVSPLRRTEEELRRALAELHELRSRLELENASLRQDIARRPEEIVGDSPAIQRVLTQVEQVAATGSTVLLLGETGVGKELVARAIHQGSGRQGRLMVKVNCAALPSTLVESELFGRERGAYTGALTRQVGRFEAADGSTIFLDEVAELPTELQAKLLRVLQDGQFERLGSTKTIKVDVRVIAATNRDLAREVRAGRFREDLFYRLNVFPIHVPPLRERRQDILPMVWAFVREFEATMGKRIEMIPRKRADALVAYPWPGNVRELRNVVERAMIVSPGATLLVEAPALEGPPPPQSATRLDDVDRRHIVAVLETTGWRVRGPQGAATRLGLKPTTLEARMAKLGIRRGTRPSKQS